MAKFPKSSDIVRQGLLAISRSPDGGIWIRTQHRVGWRSREKISLPQVSLAHPTYTVKILDAIAERLS